MEPSIACARAGVTTGEWAERAARAVRRVPGADRGRRRAAPPAAATTVAAVRARVEALGQRLGRRPKMLVGKPGLDGHSNGAEQIAVCARDCGFEVVYDGIRLTPGRIADAALEEGVHVVGLSILSGSHRRPGRARCCARLREQGLGDVPVVVGGIIPPEDAAALRGAGVAAGVHAQGLRSWPRSWRELVRPARAERGLRRLMPALRRERIRAA